MTDAAPVILKEAASAPQDENSMLVWFGMLIAFALLPFLLTMVTSFAKFVIVGGLLRQAMGTPQIPPTSVITGLAILLSVQTMSPILATACERYGSEEGTFDAGRLFDAVHDPLVTFLEENTSEADRALFLAIDDEAKVRKPEESVPEEGTNRAEERMEKARRLFTVTAPAFVLTELAEAFLIGVLLFLPFLVIDLVVSNILLAMNMHMLTPLTISLPLKILLFVLIDGWSLVWGGLITGYVR